MRSMFFATSFLFFASGSAFAQYVIGGIRYTCPVGTGWNDPRCIRETEQVAPSQTQHVYSPLAPQGRLRPGSRWGAVATDRTTGSIGFSMYEMYRVDAEDAALSRCSSISASDRCEIEVVYNEGCVAVAYPSDSYGPDRLYTIVRGRNEKVVRKDVLSACNADHDGRDCSISFSDCAMSFK